MNGINTKITKSKLAIAIHIIALVFFAFRAEAVVLDWSNYSSLSWSHSGSTYTTSIDFDPSNPGNDVTITISGDTGNFLSGYPYYSPSVDSTITGGQGASEESLLLAFNWDSKYDSVTVTFDFNYADGLENLEFSLFDIDRNTDGNNSGFRDYITDITGSYGGGSDVIPTITVEDTDYTTVLHSGNPNQAIRGQDGSIDSYDTGNAYISFGTNVVDQVSFTYGNYTSGKNSAPNNPGQQGIGVYDFSFDKHHSKVPETGTSLAGIMACLFVVLVRIWRNRTGNEPSLPSHCQTLP